MPIPFTLTPLPWEAAALEPVIPARSIAYRHGIEQKGYVDALNASAAGTTFAGLSLEEIARATAKAPKDTQLALANSAGQLWNLEFFWRSLAPRPGPPSAALGLAIALDFGGVDLLVEALVEAGGSRLEGGWAWLTCRNGVLSVAATGPARSPWEEGVSPLLAIDVWEHPYNLGRPALSKSLAAGLGKIINWDFAAANFAKTVCWGATGGASA